MKFSPLANGAYNEMGFNRQAEGWHCQYKVRLPAKNVPFDYLHSFAAAGSIYPVLHRLEQQGWIKARWDESETGRRAKFYSLSTAGRAQLETAAGGGDCMHGSRMARIAPRSNAGT